MSGKTFSSMCVNVLKAGTKHRSQACASTQVQIDLEQSTPVVTPQPAVLRTKSFSEIPGPRGSPNIGTLLFYKTGNHSIERYHDALFERYQQYGKISKETVGTETVVRLFDPDYIKKMYQQEGKHPSIPPLIEASKNYREFKGMSPGLGNVNGTDWHRLRSAVQKKMLRPKEVSDYLPMMEEVADDFIEKLGRLRKNDGKIDGFFNEVAKWNLESSGMVCFESRIGGLDENTDAESQKLIDANSDIFSMGTELKFADPGERTGSKVWQDHIDAEERFFGRGQELVDSTVKNIEALVSSDQFEEGQYKLLSYLLTRDELTYSDLSIITLSFFGDGLTSIVPTIIFTLYNLAQNPNTQNQLMDEINSALPQKGSMSSKDLQKLQYLRACIKETFRLFPVQVDIARVTTEDTYIGGYHIPPEMRVELHTFVSLRNPDIFPEPDLFKPERWLKGGSAEHVHPFIVLPFSHGPRMCIGRRFAEQDMQVLLVKILKRYQVDWNSGDMGQRYRILMTPDRDVDFTFTPRKASSMLTN